MDPGAGRDVDRRHCNIRATILLYKEIVISHSRPRTLAMAARILVIEDDPAIRELLTITLAAAGYDVEGAADTNQARAAVRNKQPDLILLDWMLPGESGVDYARRLQRDTALQKIPIIMLTARGEEENKIEGFELGADDYITKPFSPKELKARIHAVLRRTAPHTTQQVILFGVLELDSATHRVTVAGEPVRMSRIEFRLLHFFMTHPERVYTRSQLLDLVWGASVYIEERTVDVHIRRLRKVLSAKGGDGYIQTVHGIGYRLSGER